MAPYDPKRVRLMYARLVSRLYLCLGFVLLVPSLTSAATLDIPGNDTTPVRDWCDFRLEGVEATGDLTIRFNGGDPIPLLYGSERGDVRDVEACPRLRCRLCGRHELGELRGWGTHRRCIR